MGATPQPPRAPAPPAPPRPSGNIVAIVLLILALVIVVCGISIYTGVRFLSSNVKVQVQKDEGGQKDVSIRTPLGDFAVHKDAGDINEARLGLPIYPGATRVQEDGSASVSMEFPGQNSMRLAVAKFDTPDDFEKVEKFYQDRIGSQVTKLTERNSEGKMVFEIKTPDDEKVVALKSTATGTRIEMVHVLHGQNQVN